MNSIKLTFLSILTLSFSAAAQDLDLTITPTGNLAKEELHLYLQPVNETTSTPSELPGSEKGTFNKQLTTDRDGIYYLYAATPQVQMSVPVYIDPKRSKEKIKLSQGDNYSLMTSLNDASNKALSAYAALVIGKARAIGSQFNDLTDAQVRKLLASYNADADSIIAVKPIPQSVKDFIRLWAFTSANDAYALAGHLAHRANRNLGFTPDDILPPAPTVLDTPLATAFQSAPLTIMNSIPKGSLQARINALYSMYKTPEIRKIVTPMLVNSFMDSFNYGNNYEAGEKQLQAVIEQYKLPSSYLDTFRARRATLPGAPFPDVKLVDKDGNAVDFSQFKGKYVYVDLWASWCGPCCQEVPFLQALEKELEGGNVVFVSISTDAKKEPWLKKMAQLEMHGNQLWNADEELPKKLNVKGIPHFLLYNPDGTLNTYRMSRPSDPETKLKLQSLKK